MWDRRDSFRVISMALGITFHRTSHKKALIESTWLSSMMDETEKNYDEQLKNYIENNLNIKNYKILYKEIGKIPLFIRALLIRKMKYPLVQLEE